MISTQLQQRIEALCNNGCGAVWNYIDELEQGLQNKYTADLNSEECAAIL